jgi:hypothetical protein
MFEFGAGCKMFWVKEKEDWEEVGEGNIVSKIEVGG